MHIHDIRTLYDYNRWANNRILATAVRLPAEQFATASLGDCNLRDALSHTLLAEVIWRMRWQGNPLESMNFPAEFATLEELQTRWQAEAAQLEAFLATLTDADLERPLTYARANGTTETRIFWHLLVHVVNHGTQHRSELALLLTALGYSPGDLDFTVFIRQQGG